MPLVSAHFRSLNITELDFRLIYFLSKTPSLARAPGTLFLLLDATDRKSLSAGNENLTAEDARRRHCRSGKCRTRKWRANGDRRNSVRRFPVLRFQDPARFLAILSVVFQSVVSRACLFGLPRRLAQRNTWELKRYRRQRRVWRRSTAERRSSECRLSHSY